MPIILKTILGVSVFLVISVCCVYLYALSAIGTKPKDVALTTLSKSKNFNAQTRTFDNRIPNLYEKISSRFTLQEVLRLMTPVKNSSPPKALPSRQVDLASFLAPSEKIKVVWLGHSSLLIRINNRTLLIDPVFSESASPFPFLVKRYQASPISLQQLPPIDYIVISHDHYDHLDMKVARTMATKSTKYIVPLGVGSHLRGWGVPSQHISELDWWDEVKIDGLLFAATPAQHSSGRGPGALNSTLWASWVIMTENQRIYFSGDSGYDTHFADIGSKYGPFDIAFVENGQYNTTWQEMHLLPEQTLAAFKDLNAQALFPIHWGMFTLSIHSWNEPILFTSKEAARRGLRLLTPQLGEVIETGHSDKFAEWWLTVK